MIYLKLFWEFFKIGLFTFGGGYAMIPLVRDCVLNNSWLTLDEFYDFIAVTESTPGSLAVNMATYIGSVNGGFLGSLVATIGVVMPAFIIILLIASVLKKVITNKYFQNFLKGLKPVVLGLILATGIILFIKCLGYNNNTFNFNYRSLIIFALLILIYYLYFKTLKKKINTVLFICISAILGILICII